MTTDDFYQILGVSKDATTSDIKRAYRKLALKSHPDVNPAPDAKDTFAKIQNAYAVLSDPNKRRAYDVRPKYSQSSTSSYYSRAKSGQQKSTYSSRNTVDDEYATDDSFGAIFSDLVSGIASGISGAGARGGGVVEDFVEFLEKQVGVGFGVSEPTSTEAKEFESLLKYGNVQILNAELEDVEFVLKQLNERLERINVQVRAQSDMKNSALLTSDREAYAAEERRLRSRQKEIQGLIKVMNLRKERIQVAIKARQAESAAKSTTTYTTSYAKSQADSTRYTATENARRAKEKLDKKVDDELTRLKRELGL
eukprot:CAMPEP_0182449574 /NCGR_PEP_ID=MMETSP1172-20130603/35284_1 /TAXON_ID=708627 /ORGANISM="Timspurckia oligopyrenoides, Strain CCMP3278" /LENGTH=309 /DNA_ID=CAMNT_0024646895 /DNA_START=221 /DNA_END=1150 /DNA_ORIENTATION=-